MKRFLLFVFVLFISFVGFANSDAEVSKASEEKAEVLESVLQPGESAVLKKVSIENNYAYTDIQVKNLYDNSLKFGKPVTFEQIEDAKKLILEDEFIKDVSVVLEKDKKDKLIVKFIVEENLGFREFEGEIVIDTIVMKARNTTMLARKSLKELMGIETKKKAYNSESLDLAIGNISGSYVYVDIDWGIRKSVVVKNGENIEKNKLYIVVSETLGTKDLKEDTFRVDKIALLGNWITMDSVILRELYFKEGDVVTREQIEQARQNVYNLGVFTSADWGVIYAEDGTNVFVIKATDKWTLFPTVDFAVSSENLTLGVGFWDSNFLGSKSTIVVKFKLNDLMFNFLSDLTYPRIANSNFDFKFSLHYNQNNIYTYGPGRNLVDDDKDGDPTNDVAKDKNGNIQYEDDGVTPKPEFQKLKMEGYTAENVYLSAGTSYNYPNLFSVGLDLSYEYLNKLGMNDRKFLGPQESFKLIYPSFRDDFKDSASIGDPVGHYLNIATSFNIGNRRGRDIRTEGHSLYIGNTLTLDVPRNRFYDNFTFTYNGSYIPVDWFEIKGRFQNGINTSRFADRYYSFGGTSIMRSMPSGLLYGNGYYSVNFDICFTTPTISYKDFKLLSLEFSLFVDIASAAEDVGFGTPNQSIGSGYKLAWQKKPAVFGGIGVLAAVPMLQGLFVGANLGWGRYDWSVPMTAQDKKPKFFISVQKYY